MNDLELDLTNSDLVINKLGDLQLLNTEEKVARQTAQINLLTFRGEWFLDLDLGVPYFQRILRRGATKELVDSILQDVVNNSYNIQRITKWRSSLDKVTNTYNLEIFEGVVDSGEIVSITNLSIVA